jgi:hypothetical protein
LLKGIKWIASDMIFHVFSQGSKDLAALNPEIEKGEENFCQPIVF